MGIEMIELTIYLITLHILAIVRRFHVIYVRKSEAIMAQQRNAQPRLGCEPQGL